jgi:hypothetical protein
MESHKNTKLAQFPTPPSLSVSEARFSALPWHTTHLLDSSNIDSYQDIGPLGSKKPNLDGADRYYTGMGLLSALKSRSCRMRDQFTDFFDLATSVSGGVEGGENGIACPISSSSKTGQSPLAIQLSLRLLDEAVLFPEKTPYSTLFRVIVCRIGHGF